MTDYPRLFGDDLRNLLDQYDGEIQSIEFMLKAGYLSEAEYLSLSAKGITSSRDFQGDIHEYIDIEGLDKIKEKEAELVGRIMSHRLGVSYEEWSKPEAEDEDQDELFDELLACLKDAWSNDPSFYLYSFSPDRSQRVLIKLAQENNGILYPQERQRIEVYKELLSKSNSTTLITCDDDSYTWYFLDESIRGNDDASPSEIAGAMRDFFSQVEEIEGGAIGANGEEEQDSEALMSVIQRFISG